MDLLRGKKNIKVKEMDVYIKSFYYIKYLFIFECLL